MRRTTDAAGNVFITQHGIDFVGHCHADYNQSRNGNALSELVILVDQLACGGVLRAT